MSIVLFKHQQRFVEIARERPRFGFFASPGVGKTIAIYAINAEIPLKTVVLAPKSILYAAWARDGEHFPDTRVRVLNSDTKNRVGAINAGDWDLLVTNYEMFKKHGGDLIGAGVKRLVVDESSKLKNPTAAITRHVWAFADKMESVYLLSGTPAPNSGVEYYGQLRALGPLVAGRSFYSFEATYFHRITNKIRVKGGMTRTVTVGHGQTPGQLACLQALLKKHSWSLRKEDCMDLPPKTDVVIRVSLEKEADHYARAVNELKIETGNGEKSFRAEASMMKLRQIVNGSVKIGGISEKIGTSKMEALDELLDELGSEPVVIWAEFTEDIKEIQVLLMRRKEEYGVIDGRTSGEAGDTAAAFQGGKIKRLVCHPQAAGHGITLTAASYAIYFSLSFSYEQYEQSRDRIHRAGQTRPCTYYHLIASGTVDETCLKVVRRKASTADAVRMVLAQTNEPQPA